MSDQAILTSKAMPAAEQALFDGGVDPFALMRTAGEAAAAMIWRIGGPADTLILCGPGNNGGDGYVIAAALAERGVPVRVAAIAEPRTESARKARALWKGQVESLAEAAPAQQLVDALFGIGLSRGLDPAWHGPLRHLARTARRAIAIDMPSGVDSDTGECLSPVPSFDLTLIPGALKPAHLLYPAAGLVGSPVLLPIGIDSRGATSRRLGKPVLRRPAYDAHKYSRGLVLVIGGGMAGAGRLAARAAQHAGAGYVKLLTDGVAPLQPDALVKLLPDAQGGIDHALEDERIGAVVIGPGLGRDQQARRWIDAALSSGRPLVIDGDALALIKPRVKGRRLPAGAILTPHEGEFGSLFGSLPGSKIERARKAAEESGATIVYKGPDTVIASEGRILVGSDANPWLSTAGTGDVLAGTIGARLAVTGDPMAAAGQGVWLHGEAARRAGAAFVADDLIARLPLAVEACL